MLFQFIKASLKSFYKTRIRFTLPLILWSPLVNELNKDKVFFFFLVIANVSDIKGSPKNSNQFNSIIYILLPTLGFTEQIAEFPCAVWTSQDWADISNSLSTAALQPKLYETLPINMSKTHIYLDTDVLISNLRYLWSTSQSSNWRSSMRKSNFILLLIRGGCTPLLRKEKIKMQNNPAESLLKTPATNP